MTMTEWGKHTAPHLQSIEGNAAWISHYCGSIKEHARKLEYAIKGLKERPAWETKAQDELGKSIETLQVTLALCRSALEAYDSRPVMAEFTEAAE